MNQPPLSSQLSSILRNRWFLLGVGMLIVSLILAFSLNMSLYSVSLTAGLLGVALAGYFILRITLRPV